MEDRTDIRTDGGKGGGWIRRAKGERVPRTSVAELHVHEPILNVWYYVLIEAVYTSAEYIKMIRIYHNTKLRSL